MKVSAEPTNWRMLRFSRCFVVAIGLAMAMAASSCNTPTGQPVPLNPPTVTDTGTARQAPPLQDDSIHIGDKLEVFVSEDESFNGIYQVREKGDIILPRLGRVQVENLSVERSEIHIKNLLEENQLREATVIVDRVARAGQEGVGGTAGSPEPEGPKFLAYFTGKVQRPGQHWITLPRGKPVGIYEAILISGGLARFANDRKVEVLRKDEQGRTRKMMLDLRAVRDGKAPDPPLYEGDIVFVPEKRIGL